MLRKYEKLPLRMVLCLDYNLRMKRDLALRQTKVLCIGLRGTLNSRKFSKREFNENIQQPAGVDGLHTMLQNFLIVKCGYGFIELDVLIHSQAELHREGANNQAYVAFAHS